VAQRARTKHEKRPRALRALRTNENDDLTEATIGAAIEVQRLLGPGLLESIYEEALAVELALRGIACTRQVAIDVTSKVIPSRDNDSIFWWRMR
jgi:hypothetical protein